VTRIVVYDRLRALGIERAGDCHRCSGVGFYPDVDRVAAGRYERGADVPFVECERCGGTGGKGRVPPRAPNGSNLTNDRETCRKALRRAIEGGAS